MDVLSQCLGPQEGSCVGGAVALEHASVMCPWGSNFYDMNGDPTMTVQCMADDCWPGEFHRTFWGELLRHVESGCSLSTHCGTRWILGRIAEDSRVWCLPKWFGTLDG